jgi:hypothetical protein
MTIALGACESNDERKVTFYAPPLDAVPCKSCGSSYQYGSDDLIVFEGEANIAVFDPVKRPT